jgi:hypothetical protein
MDDDVGPVPRHKPLRRLRVVKVVLRQIPGEQIGNE